jgi:uncharacterized protein YcaQ
VHRHYPDLAEQARSIRQADARRKLAELYLRSVGAARERDLAALFGWAKRDVTDALGVLAQDGVLDTEIEVSEQPGAWVALAELY